MPANSIKGFKVGNEVKKYDYDELDNLPENDPDDLAEEISDLKSDLSNTNDVLEMPLSETVSKAIAYDSQNYIENITLKKGITYTLKATLQSAVSSIYVWLRDSANNNLIAFVFDGTTTEKTGTYTPTETLENCKVIAMTPSAPVAGTVLTVELTSNEQNAIEAINNRIDNLPNSEELITEITGYEKPNLISGSFREYTYNGITYTVNSDGSIQAVGTASDTSYTNAIVTLPAGKYLLNGCEGGSSQSYHLAIILNGAFVYQYGGVDKAFSLLEETTLAVYCRVVRGQTVDVTFYPMIRLASVYNPTYAPYDEYQVYKPIQQLIDYTKFNWSGKKMNVIGDSIVQGYYGNFINVIRDILCLSVARNYGIGGSCLASSSADSQYQPAVLRYENMDTDAQIIIVHAGTNDYSAQIPLGDPTSTDITTFNGALNVMMNGLREMYPTALIIFDSILHRFNDEAFPIKASEYRQCIEDRCLANHVVFYDAYKYSGFDFVKGYYDHILTSDGLHPNQTGANILGRKLAGFIRWN